MTVKSGDRIFYGWYIVAAGCVVIGMTAGIIMNCFSQFIKPVCADMGFTRQQMGMNQTIVSVISMGFALVWGSLSQRITLIKWMRGASILLPVIYFCYSFAQSLGMFYAITVLLGIVNCAVSMMIFTYIVGVWFVKKRGMAIGLASMGSGIGALIMNTVISQLILSLGWRATYRVVAVMMMIAIVPTVWLIVREKPSDMGLLPYGYGEADENGKTPGQRAPAGYSYAQALRMPVFWAVALSSVGLVMAICVFYQTLAPHLSDSGYTVTFAALMSSTSMGALAVGKVILGKLFDRFGTRKAATFACASTFIGIIGMIFCQSPVALVAIILGVGLGCSFGAVCMPIITQNIFGMQSYNAIYGKLTAATGLGSALAPVISGRVYDNCGSYIPIYVVAAGITLAGICTLLIALPKQDNA